MTTLTGMINLGGVARLVEYGDWANGRVLECAGRASEEQLDRGLEIGPGAGSLRRVLVHTWAGEDMWLRRWKGDLATKWPNESEKLAVGTIRERFEIVATDRSIYLKTVKEADLARDQEYRDSKGGLFRAAFGDMLIQGLNHSTHHRAQAVNALRRLGLEWPELDYMMRIRRPG